jgi:indole-3-glycerol phosphate synthase
MDILEMICAHKRQEIERQKEEMPLDYILNFLDVAGHSTISLKQALIHSSSGIIAEFKRRSPSKGWIHPNADAPTITQAYEQAGATAVSILTDQEFFGGSFRDFRKSRKCITRIPILRKDFILDDYQIYQSKVLGADVVLLIAACLTQEETARLARLAHQLGLEVLLEIHDEAELAYVQPYADVVGINNRDLKTFATDIRHTIALAEQIPSGYVKISESGISDPQTVIELRKAGFQGFLMGENFMKTGRPAETLQTFIQALT